MANNLQTQILAVGLVALVAVDVSCAEETSGDRPNLVPIITTAAGKWHWEVALGRRRWRSFRQNLRRINGWFRFADGAHA